jgi:hypothetical protein
MDLKLTTRRQFEVSHTSAPEGSMDIFLLGYPDRGQVGIPYQVLLGSSEVVHEESPGRGLVVISDVLVSQKVEQGGLQGFSRVGSEQNVEFAISSIELLFQQLKVVPICGFTTGWAARIAA